MMCGFVYSARRSSLEEFYISFDLCSLGRLAPDIGPVLISNRRRGTSSNGIDLLVTVSCVILKRVGSSYIHSATLTS